MMFLCEEGWWVAEYFAHLTFSLLHEEERSWHVFREARFFRSPTFSSDTLPSAPRLCLFFMHVRLHGYQARNRCGIRIGPTLLPAPLDFTWRRRYRYEKVSNWFRLSCFRKSGHHFPRAFPCGAHSFESSSSFSIFVCGCCQA